MGVLRPSRDSALIVAVELPAGLEALRHAHVPDAASEGMPAHATLLYPFAEPASLDAGVLERIAALCGGHGSWAMTLGASARWPDTLYATVEPDAPIRALQADLATAFPELPLYGDPGLRFEPHVTIAEGTGSETWAIADDPAWAELPVTLPVDEVALIVRRDGKWAVERAFPLRRRSVA